MGTRNFRPKIIVVLFLLFAGTSVFAQTFRVEGGLAASFIRLVDLYDTDNIAPGPGVELGGSIFFKPFLGAGLFLLTTFPIEPDYGFSSSIQVLSGPTFFYRSGSLALSATPGIYGFFQLNSEQFVSEVGLGVSGTIEFHLDSLVDIPLYIYGRMLGSYSFDGQSGNLTVTPSLGVGFNIDGPWWGAVLEGKAMFRRSAPALSAAEYNKQGVEAFNAKDWDSAVAAFTEALRLSPDSGAVKKNLANALNARGAVAEAAARGAAAAAAKNWDTAVSDYTEAMRLDPENEARKKILANTYNSRGAAAFNAKKWGAAVADFTEAVRLDPESEAKKKNLEAARIQAARAGESAGGQMAP
ncbi:MAG: hypothetical protein LBR23_03280 [Spirochaetaceae bacterium]|jgi:Flp pilus assembly protein TadD|nr:hypothetical protein [Spirochaetaceae bacterium]